MITFLCMSFPTAITGFSSANVCSRGFFTCGTINTNIVDSALILGLNILSFMIMFGNYISILYVVKNLVPTGAELQNPSANKKVN